MNTEHSIFILCLIISALLSGYLSIILYRLKGKYNTGYFFIFNCSMFIWTVLYALELTAYSLPDKMLMVKIEYFGIATSPVFAFIAIYNYIESPKRISFRIVSLMLIIPVLTILIMWTNEYHYFIYQNPSIRDMGGFSRLEKQGGPWFYVHVIYSYIFLASGTICLFRYIVKRRQIFRAQIIAMIIALSLPWLSNMDYILHGAQEYDFTPIAFIFSGAILFWAMSAVKLFSIVPIARDLVFELMDDSIFVLDEQNRIIDANASAKKFISEDKFLGKSIDELSGKFPEKLSEILNTPDQQIEIPYGEKTYAVQVTVLQTGDEVKNGAILSLRDITSRKVAELSLRNTEASLRKSESELLELNASKDKFFSIIAHDLKSPFTGIIGLIEILVSDSETFSPEERKRWLADLLKLSLNTLKLLENLLQWSQIQIGSVKPDRHLHNLNELLQSCLYAVKQPAEVKKIAFRDAIPPDMVIFTDANIMSLVIRNLLNNAIKFSYPEGDVTISARKIAGSFEIIVEDNGTGISPGMLQNLFRIDKAVSKHGTAGEKGTGLGLILCREFVNKLQGTLDVESIEGQGSKFIITLPDEAGAEEKD